MVLNWAKHMSSEARLFLVEYAECARTFTRTELVHTLSHMVCVEGDMNRSTIVRMESAERVTAASVDWPQATPSSYLYNTCPPFTI